MTLFFANEEIQIYRKRRKGSSDRWVHSATFTAYPADIQPEAPERVEFVQGRVGATYLGFVNTDVEVKEGDQVKVIGGTFDGKRFSVKGVSHWENAGLLDSVELTLVAQDG